LQQQQLHLQRIFETIANNKKLLPQIKKLLGWFTPRKCITKRKPIAPQIRKRTPMMAKVT
jgi:hypothetical protein